MKITSAAFNNGERIPQQYTCEGPNVSPPLSFTDVPAEAKSLVLIVEDPDAPAKPWVHWLVYNIPPQCGGFEEAQIAEGAQQGLCNGNTFGYEGPCPPENEHEYLFTLYALDVVLDTPPNESARKNMLQQMQGHVIEEAVLTGRYQKERTVVAG
jgi:Raf kinase inhibitor-like YbhB/YbcL family protein